jgi:hypothetical protein
LRAFKRLIRWKNADVESCSDVETNHDVESCNDVRADGFFLRKYQINTEFCLLLGLKSITLFAITESTAMFSITEPQLQ